MPTDTNSLAARRRYAGTFFAVGALTTFFAVIVQSTPMGSVLESVAMSAKFAGRALAALILWTVATGSIVVACLLVANVLRGRRTRTALLGCVLLACGAMTFFALRFATGGIRYLLGVGGVDPASAAHVDALLRLPTSSVVGVLPLLILGGTLIAIGFDHAGASSWFTGATWSIALVCYGLVAGVWWAEALTAAAIALALLVMGIDIARFRPAFALGGEGPPTRITSS